MDYSRLNRDQRKIEELERQVALKDERIRELEHNFELMSFANSDGKTAYAKLEQQLKAAQAALEIEQTNYNEVWRDLKAAQERLTEADSLLYRWKESRPTTVEREEVAYATAEYLAKHYPSSVSGQINVTLRKRPYEGPKPFEDE